MLGVGLSSLSLRRGLRQGLQNIVRESGWASALASLTGMMLLCQFLVLAVVGLGAGIRMLGEQTDLRLEILEGATDKQIQDFIQNVQSLPYVTDTAYITREQAYERFKNKDPELIGLFSAFGVENPFPETVGVRLRRLGDYDQFVTFLKQPAFASVVNPNFLSTTTDQEREIRSVLDAISGLRLFVAGGTIVLGIVLLLVIMELLRRRALLRSDELFIEQLVGASPATILFPFFVEMLVLLLISLALSAVIGFLLALLLPWLLPMLSPTGLLGSWMQLMRSGLLRSLPVILLAKGVGIVVLAGLGTSFAMKDQLSLLKSSSGS